MGSYDDFARRWPRWTAWKERNAVWYEEVLAVTVIGLLVLLVAAVFTKT